VTCCVCGGERIGGGSQVSVTCCVCVRVCGVWERGPRSVSVRVRVCL